MSSWRPALSTRSSIAASRGRPPPDLGLGLILAIVAALAILLRYASIDTSVPIWGLSVMAVSRHAPAKQFSVKE